MNSSTCVASQVDVALPASWVRDDLPSARDARAPLDALSAAHPDLEGSTSGFVMRWVTSHASLSAPQVEVEQRSFAAPAQARAAETSWCRLLTRASQVPHSGGLPAGSTGLLPLRGADGGLAFSLPPLGPLGYQHDGVTVVALHRSGRLLSIVEAAPQPDLPPAKQNLPRRLVVAALPPMIAALGREGGPGSPLALSPKALLEQTQVTLGPGPCGLPDGAVSEPTAPFSVANRPDYDAPDAAIAANCTLFVHVAQFDVTDVRFTSGRLAAAYAARLGSSSLFTPSTISGQPTSLEVDYGLVEAITRFDTDVFSFDAYLPAGGVTGTDPTALPTLTQIINVVRDGERASTRNTQPPVAA